MFLKIEKKFIDIPNGERVAYVEKGTGDKVINQYPKIGSNILSYDKVILITNDEIIKMPNLVGWSKKDAKNILEMLNINYKMDGTGYVVAQDIAVDTIITNDMIVNISLSDKYNLEEVD